MKRIALALLATLVAGSASAELYRWVDRDGRVHYTDRVPESAKSVEMHKTAPNVMSSATPFAVQQAAKNFPVKLYTGTNCGSPCADARDVLTKRGVPYAEVSVTQKAQLDELKRVSGGEEVPVTLVGRAVLKGFAPDSFNAALDNAGYPRNAGRSAPAAQTTKTAEATPSGATSGSPSGDDGKGAVAPPGETKAGLPGLEPKKGEAAGTEEVKGPYAPR